MNPHKLYHSDDPTVSRVAAVTVTGGSNSTQVMRAIVHLLGTYGPRTPDQLEALYYRNAPGEQWPVVGFKFVNKRVSELKKHVGVLHGTGERENGGERVELTCDPLDALTRIDKYKRRTAA